MIIPKVRDTLKILDINIYMIILKVRDLLSSFFALIIDDYTREITQQEMSLIINYSQTCIKRSPLGQRKSGFVRPGDLLKEC
jgi:hypothetical protein